MFLQVLVAIFCIFMLLQPAFAQNLRRRSPGLPQAPATDADKIPAGDNDGANLALRRTEIHGWVWVSRTIDMAEHLGGAENLMTLDGEPLPSMRKPSVTLGLVIDDQGHIVTRLVGATPANPPMDITVRGQGGRPAPAKFLGMDAVTGLCVLKVEGASLTTPTFSAMAALPGQLRIRLYGFHPRINQNSSVMGSLYPRCNAYSGQVVKALEDFRFNSRNPIYYLLSPQISLAQDCSLILDEDDSVFGVAVYNIGGEGNHLVYPVSRLQTIAQSVIESHTSIAYGWLGAQGQDALRSAPTRVRRLQSPAERGAEPATVDLGVRILNIAPDSPAEIAGVKPHDVVVAVNDHRISTYSQMVSMMMQISPDNEVSLKVKRGNEYKLLKAKLTSAPAFEPEQQFVVFNRKIHDLEKKLNSLPPTDPNRPHLESRKDAWRKFVNGLEVGIWNQAPIDVRLRVLYGIEIQALTDQLISYFAAPNGLLVSNVSEGAIAARSGLQAGDVIIAADARQINKLADLVDALDSANNSPIVITVARRGNRLKLTFQR